MTAPLTIDALNRETLNREIAHYVTVHPARVAAWWEAERRKYLPRRHRIVLALWSRR